MADKPQELTLALLKEAMEKGTLDLTIEKGPAVLISAEERPKVKETLKTSAVTETSESENLSPGLAFYRQEYDRLPDAVRARCDWKTLSERLLANDSEKLKLAQSMQGNGQLFGIDAEGRALFKDRGVEPVMYGFDKKGMLRIFNRDPEKMRQIIEWANYCEVRAYVLKDGYELFADDGNYGFSEEMIQVTDHTGEPLVASKDRKEQRASWLESGKRPDVAREIFFRPDSGHTGGDECGSRVRDDIHGVVRLLRV